MDAMKKVLVLAFLSIGLSVTPSWAHEGHPVKEVRDVNVTAPQQFSRSSEVTAQESAVHGSAVHDREASFVDICPQLAYEAETDGLRECVTVLTHQISDLLRLIMNLSDALAESQNQLMRSSHEPQGRPIIQSTAPQL